MPDVHTQTPMTGNRIETVLKEIRSLRNAKYKRTFMKKRRANKRMVDQVGKRMAEHIVGAVQKTVKQARKKARAPAASAVLPPQPPWPCARCNVGDRHGLAAAGRHDAVRHGGADLRRWLGRRSGSRCLLV